MALIVDDRVRGRDHRRNIFNPNYNAAAAAYGPHAIGRGAAEAALFRESVERMDRP
jgi:hypothetical protein